MGEVVSFHTRHDALPAPRILILSDTKVKPDMLCNAFFYATKRMSGVPAALLARLQGPTACVSCAIGPEPDALQMLHYFTKSSRVKIVGVVCLMKCPPRAEIEKVFPDTQIFFENPDFLHAMAKFTRISAP